MKKGGSGYVYRWRKGRTSHAWSRRDLGDHRRTHERQVGAVLCIFRAPQRPDAEDPGGQQRRGRAAPSHQPPAAGRDVGLAARDRGGYDGKLEPPLPGEYGPYQKRRGAGGGPCGQGADAPRRQPRPVHGRAQDAAQRQADPAERNDAGGGYFL